MGSVHFLNSQEICISDIARQLTPPAWGNLGRPQIDMSLMPDSVKSVHLLQTNKCAIAPEYLFAVWVAHSQGRNHAAPRRRLPRQHTTASYALPCNNTTTHLSYATPAKVLVPHIISIHLSSCTSSNSWAAPSTTARPQHYKSSTWDTLMSSPLSYITMFLLREYCCVSIILNNPCNKK